MNTEALADQIADDIIEYIKNHPNEVSDRDIMIKFIQKGLDVAVDYTIEQCYFAHKTIDEENLDKIAEKYVTEYMHKDRRECFDEILMFKAGYRYEK